MNTVVRAAAVTAWILATGTLRADERAAHEQMQTVTALGMAKLTLANAVEIALKQVPDGLPAEADLDLDDGRAVFEVNVRAGAAHREIRIDAVSGKVLKTESEARAGGSLPSTRLTVREAVDAAVKHAGTGRPYEVELEKENGQPVWKVGVLAADRFKTVLVAAADGKVLATRDDTAVLALWTFDGIERGKLPENWLIRENNPTKELARWGARPDPEAASPPNLLAVRTANDNATYNLAIAEKISIKDFEMSVRVRPQTGGYDQGGGLIWRCQDPNNYYICRINPLESNYRVYKVVNGKRQQLQSIEARTPAGKWHTLHVTMIGDRITCYLNGNKMLNVRDDTFKESGMVGLWTKADASSSFDDLVVIEAGSKQKREKEEDDDGEEDR